MPYVLLTVASGSVAGLSVRLDAGFTFREYALLPVSALLLLSVALIVKLDVPEVGGVPLNVPVLEFNTKPDGKLPALTENEYVPDPPVAFIVTL